MELPIPPKGSATSRHASIDDVEKWPLIQAGNARFRIRCAFKWVTESIVQRELARLPSDKATA